ncbi:MAG: hypothetical protein LBH21_04520 [Gracilibacteraceae bacterium]|jgi:methyl-accepting chemotaxis protein|nr:hypothetical protein [Gracilibacteraceae bacterium]
MWRGVYKKQIILITFLFIFVITAGLGNFRAKQLATDIVAARANNVVQLLSASLDMAEIERLALAPDERDPYFLALREQMEKTLAEHELRGLYIVAKNEDFHWYYIVDGRGPEHPLYFPAGTVDDNIDDAMTERAVRGLDASKRYAAGGSSARISAYGGLQAPDGEYIAVVGADYDAMPMTQFLYTTKYAQIFVVGAGFLLLALFRLLAPLWDENGRPLFGGGGSARIRK